MRSTAHLKGHPIHPALVPFPLAALAGAALFDALGTLIGAPTLWTTARHLTVAGLLFGLLAAIPGVIDFTRTVPPRSSARQRARTHGLLNTTALALFATALAVRGDGVAPGLIVLALEIAGAGTLLYSGSLGGTLVNRNMIGVDHRYADSGKWSEVTLDGSSGSVVAAREADLKPGQMKLLHVNGRRIVLGRTPERYVAFDDRCTHRGGSLAGGVLIGGTVQCLWHGSQFDVTSGAVRCGPAEEGVGCYRVEVSGGDVRVHVTTGTP